MAAISRAFPIKTDADGTTREAPVDLADRHVDDGAGYTESRADLSAQQGEREISDRSILSVSISGGCILFSSRTLNWPFTLLFFY